VVRGRTHWSPGSSIRTHTTSPPSIEGATVIDVGANIGCFSLACAERGASSLHCHEADPVTASICRQNLSGLDGVTVEPVAVWGGAIPPEIRFSRHSPDDSGIGTMVFDDGGRGEVVPTIDIDDVLTSTCDVHGGNITILKMDCEGAEYPIIYGYWLDKLRRNTEDDRVGFRSVPAWNTSIMCPRCGLIDRRNRPSQGVFHCRGCDHTGDADVVASENIEGRFLSGPYGAGCKPLRLSSA